MSETRKIAAILVTDVVGYSRLAGADEGRTLARLRGLRSDLVDPAIDAHHGRIIKRTGNGSIIEFRRGSAICLERVDSMPGEPGFFDTEERLRELSAKRDDLFNSLSGRQNKLPDTRRNLRLRGLVEAHSVPDRARRHDRLRPEPRLGRIQHL
jgi:class 3 adenylate cyclase